MPASKSTSLFGHSRGAIILAVIIACAALGFALNRNGSTNNAARLYETGSPEMPPVLAHALQHERELAAYQTVSVQQLPSGATMTVTRSRLRLPNGALLQRTVRDFAGTAGASKKSLTQSDVVISNEAGQWHLFPGVAIRQPASDSSKLDPVLSRLAGADNISQSVRYQTRQDTWNGQACTVVVRIEPAASVDLKRDAVRDLIAQEKSEEKGTRLPGLTAESFAAAITEYFIDPTLNFVVRRHTIAMNDNTIVDDAFASVDLAPRLSRDLFEIPPDAVQHFPGDLAEYNTLSGKYARITRINNNPKQP